MENTMEIFRSDVAMLICTLFVHQSRAPELKLDDQANATFTPTCGSSFSAFACPRVPGRPPAR